MENTWLDDRKLHEMANKLENNCRKQVTRGGAKHKGILLCNTVCTINRYSSDLSTGRLACCDSMHWLPYRLNVVKGTLCTDCHSESVPKTHSALECNLCHSPFGWEGRKIDHKDFSATACTDCHAEDKPAPHFALKCDACHSIKAWLPVSFDHDQNESADCISCHAVRPGHFDLVCSTCHTTNAWSPQNVDHASLTDCVSCHESKRPDNHYPGFCSTCHSTTAWSPQNVNHADFDRLY